MPGYGFSGKPDGPGWDPQHIARAWTELMRRLGYTRFVAQGGDWGALITDMLGVQAPPELARHPHQHARRGAAGRRRAAAAGITGVNNPLAELPAGLSDEERAACERLDFFWKHSAYALIMTTRPQTLTALADSPVGLATFMLDHDAASLDLICAAFAGRPAA